MELENLITQTRTFRRFKQNHRIDANLLKKCIDLARLGGSARNAQPWQYAIVTDPLECNSIFPYLSWAGYLPDWKGPKDGEQPAAYILCLLHHQWLQGPEKEAHFDLGIASQNLLLGAMEKGLGGCRIAAFSPRLAELFSFPTHLSLELVIALGKPAEEIVIEKVEKEVKYWHSGIKTHHVPKRTLEDVLVELKWK